MYAEHVAKVRGSTNNLVLIRGGKAPTGQHQRATSIGEQFVENLFACVNSFGQSLKGNLPPLFSRLPSIDVF
jgi:hypothetical protein